MLGLGGAVRVLQPFTYAFNAANFSVQPTGWPAWGSARPADDLAWRRRLRAAQPQRA